MKFCLTLYILAMSSIFNIYIYVKIHNILLVTFLLHIYNSSGVPILKSDWYAFVLLSTSQVCSFVWPFVTVNRARYSHKILYFLESKYWILPVFVKYFFNILGENNPVFCIFEDISDIWDILKQLGYFKTFGIFGGIWNIWENTCWFHSVLSVKIHFHCTCLHNALCDLQSLFYETVSGI